VAFASDTQPATIHFSAVLWGYWLTKRTIGYLYAAYASTVVWFGALVVSLALLGSTQLAAVGGAFLVVGLPFMFIRDKRRMAQRGSQPGQPLRP
jgi:hypothetical protein